MDQEKEILMKLSQAGFVTIPSVEDSEAYEDKLLQSRLYRKWMPRTLISTNRAEAESFVGTLPYPFISKSRTGSASCNVRLVKSAAEARKEIAQAFGPIGLRVPHKLGEHIQKGYIIWQEFCLDNPYDYRVCRIGNDTMMLRRYNRDDVPFASGSGKTEPVKILDGETLDVFTFADQFFTATGTKWCGIDVVKARGGWKLLETTIGWSQKAYADCVFFESGRPGADIWELTADQLERGVFG